MVAVASPSRPKAILDRLAGLAGPDGLVTGAAATPFAIDVYRRGTPPLAVLRPDTVEALQALVGEAVRSGLAVFPRGGGASYTDGYIPDRPQAVIVDTGRLDRIVEINETDAYVTVEAGVTWAALKAALDPLGLRTPFFGPFSGIAATVGGSVSQNTLSHGSGAHGISAQSLLALDVVTASGKLVRTGSAARGAAPFARFYGPDLTGLFTGDCGALGVKARITLPLLRKKPAFQCASFCFGSLEDLADAMRAAALERLDDSHFAIDANLAQGQIARQTTASVLQMAGAIMASSPNPIVGLTQLLRMAAAGSDKIRRAEYLLHFIVEGVDDAEAKAKLARLRVLMARGAEIPNSIAAVVRAMPFAPLFNTLGPSGERWVPLHGVLPHSKVAAFHADLQSLYAKHADAMARLGVWTGAMFGTIGSTGFLYEVAIYWPGEQTDYHRAVLPAEHLADLPQYPENAETVAFVARLKSEMVDLLGAHGAVHFQLGRAYPFAGELQPEPLALLKAIKAELDPTGLMNPGVLGL